MSQTYPNIYQTSRMTARYTQEEAAELLYTSGESIKAYESGRRIPPEHIAVAMAEVYNDRALVYYWLKDSIKLAGQLLPTLTIATLPAAMLRLEKEMNDFVRCRERLLDITYDGIITAEERPEFNGILKELDDISNAIMTLKYAKE